MKKLRQRIFLIFILFLIPLSAFAQDPEVQYVDNTNYAVLVATAVIAGATIYYAWQAKRSVIAIEATKEAQFLPHVVASIIYLGPTAIVLEISNIGKGGAKDLSVTYRIREIPSTERTWRQNVLKADDKQIFYLQRDENTTELNVDYFKNNQTKLEVWWSCKDIFQNNHDSSQEIDITNFVKQFELVKAQYKEDEITSISRKIGSIDNTMRSIYQDIHKIQREKNETKHSQLVDFQIELAKKKINNLKIRQSSKAQINALLGDVGNILRLDYMPDDEPELLAKLKEIKSKNKKAFEVVTKTVFELKWLKGFKELSD